MTDLDVSRLEKALLAFVERVAADKGATPEELAALPEVANILVKLTCPV